MDPLTFDGRVAVITGAGGGLGRSHALELARRGAHVVVNDLGGAVDGTGGSASAAEQVVAEIRAAGGEAIANADSVATPDGGAAIVECALDTFGRVDIVVNNAGILRDAAFKNVTPALLDAVIDVHLKGAFNVLRTAWPHLREQNYGRVVNTSSGSGLFGNFGQSNYGAAKAGLMGLTRVLSIEGARNNVMANAIAPIAHTRMTEGQIDESMAPELISPLVAYLCHASCAVTGQAYSVGGGRVSRVFLGMTTGVTDPTLDRGDGRRPHRRDRRHRRVRHPLVRRAATRPCAAAPRRALEQRALHLARGGLREQLVPDHELLGDLPLRGAGRDQTVDHRVERQLGARTQANGHRQALARRVVGHAVARALLHPRQLRDHPVDLADRDLEPVADHDVLDPARDAQPAVAQLGEVARAEPVVVERAASSSRST